MLVIGSSGSGKTFSTTNFLNEIADNLDKVYVINPACDKQIRNVANKVNLYKEYDNSDNATLETIIAEIKMDINTFKKYMFYKELYNRFKKLKIPEDIHIPFFLEQSGFEKNEIRLLKAYDYQPTKIAFMDFDYKIRPPNSLIILDDCVGSSIYREGRSPLINFLIKSRHFKTNIILLSQYHKAVPKRIRANITHFVLFKSFDRTLIQSIYDEINSYLSFEEFEQLFKENTKEKYSFIVIDLKNQRITRGWNDVIYSF
jgi:Cdc6-like AAA superfamily ATPase